MITLRRGYGPSLYLNSMHFAKYKITLWCLLAAFWANAQYTASDWEYRDEWMDVERIFRMAGVRPGDAVADVGCHEGYLSVRLAEAVGKKGKVYAVDVREDRLNTLEKNARERKLSQIQTVLGDYDNPHLPAEQLNIVFVMDTYHEIKAYEVFLEHLNAALKPGGRIVILEKLKEHARNKSREDQVLSHTLSSKFVKKELKKAGFTLITEIEHLGYWEEERDKKIWMLVAQKD